MKTMVAQEKYIQLGADLYFAGYTDEGLRMTSMEYASRFESAQIAADYAEFIARHFDAQGDWLHEGKRIPGCPCWWCV